MTEIYFMHKFMIKFDNCKYQENERISEVKLLLNIEKNTLYNKKNL